MQSVRMQAHTHLTFHGYWRSVLLTRSTDADVAVLFPGTWSCLFLSSSMDADVAGPFIETGVLCFCQAPRMPDVAYLKAMLSGTMLLLKSSHSS